MPWVKEASLVRPPASALAAPRTTTAVMGMAPSRPQRMLPIPCARSSRLTGVMRFLLSNLSTASTHNKVSKVASNPMIIPCIQMMWVVKILDKSGKTICVKTLWGFEQVACVLKSNPKLPDKNLIKNNSQYNYR